MPSAFAQSASVKATEADVRAAFIHRILMFASWESPTGGEIIVCSAGSDENADALLSLTELLKTKPRQQHKPKTKRDVFRIVPLNSGVDRSACRVTVFNGGTESSSSEYESLVICNGCSDRGELAAIELVKRDSQIRYVLNLKMLESSGARLRSDVVKWALRVEGR